MLADDILIVPSDVDVAEMGEFLLGRGPLPERCYVEPIAVWMARGRVSDCDCDLLQCECEQIRSHSKGCAFRLSITSVVDVGCMECDCGVIEWLTSG
jgi:hypothetical protein